MKPYDELPWWCQLLWPWFGPPWYEQGRTADSGDDPRWALARQAADRRAPGPGDHQRRVRPARTKGEDAGDEYDEPIPDMGRPLVVGRDHPSWAEVDAEQRERIGDPPGEDGPP